MTYSYRHSCLLNYAINYNCKNVLQYRPFLYGEFTLFCQIWQIRRKLKLKTPSMVLAKWRRNFWSKSIWPTDILPTRRHAYNNIILITVHYSTSLFVCRLNVARPNVYWPKVTEWAKFPLLFPHESTSEGIGRLETIELHFKWILPGRAPQQ